LRTTLIGESPAQCHGAVEHKPQLDPPFVNQVFDRQIRS
jgi:hypothetical protein